MILLPPAALAGIPVPPVSSGGPGPTGSTDESFAAALASLLVVPAAVANDAAEGAVPLPETVNDEASTVAADAEVTPEPPPILPAPPLPVTDAIGDGLTARSKPAESGSTVPSPRPSASAAMLLELSVEAPSGQPIDARAPFAEQGAIGFSAGGGGAMTGLPAADATATRSELPARQSSATLPKERPVAEKEARVAEGRTKPHAGEPGDPSRPNRDSGVPAARIEEVAAQGKESPRARGRVELPERKESGKETLLPLQPEAPKSPPLLRHSSPAPSDPEEKQRGPGSAAVPQPVRGAPAVSDPVPTAAVGPGHPTPPHPQSPDPIPREAATVGRSPDARPAADRPHFGRDGPASALPVAVIRLPVHAALADLAHEISEVAAPVSASAHAPASVHHAAVAPAMSPPTPVPVAALPAIAISVASDPGSGQIDLRLSPEELGNVRMHIHCDGNDLRVLVVADRPETFDLLRRNGAALLSEFADAGFSRMSLDFAQGGMPERQSPAAYTGEPGPQTGTGGIGSTEPPAEPWAAGHRASGRLDLRI